VKIENCRGYNPANTIRRISSVKEKAMTDRRYDIQTEIVGNCPNSLYAHSLDGQPPEKWQTLAEHLNAVAGLAEEFATPFGAGDWARAATQPALPKLDPVTEIIPNDKKTVYYQKLRRVNFHFPADLNQRISLADLAARLQRHEQVLCVMNTRAECRRLFELMPEGTLHLSALMCGEHRSQVIAEIKKRLADAAPTRVISTQVIEAGVDVDFPTVYRALAGLDSIVQTAGRCNREGKLQDKNGDWRHGDCYIFAPEKPAPHRCMYQAQDSQFRWADQRGKIAV
jgi:CRISPR-associated endonuclease/helicase Cas3